MKIRYAVFNARLRTDTVSGILDYHYTEATKALGQWPANSEVVKLSTLKSRYRRG